MILTHPDLSKAALSQFEVEAEGLSGNLPGVPGQSLRLGFGHRTHICESMAQPIRVLWEKKAREVRVKGQIKGNVTIKG